VCVGIAVLIDACGHFHHWGIPLFCFSFSPFTAQVITAELVRRGRYHGGPGGLVSYLLVIVWGRLLLCARASFFVWAGTFLYVAGRLRASPYTDLQCGIVL